MEDNLKNILIIGYGFVGKSVEYSLTKNEQSAEFNFLIHDPKKGLDSTQGAPVDSIDAVFICVPTPSNVDGSCDTSLVFEYVSELSLVLPASTVLVLKSTVPPSAIKQLLEIYPTMIYMPEFLREKTWQEDSLNPPITVVGGLYVKPISDLLEILKQGQANIFKYEIVTPLEASIFKYLHNTFLATKVVFMHEAAIWTKETFGENVGWDSIAHLLNVDPPVGNNHTKAPGDHGYGYGGSCFPKDVDAFISETQGSGLNNLLNYVRYRNAKLQYDSNEL